MSSLSERLSVIQNELKAPKGQFNSFGKYKYRSCEDILEAIKPLLKGISLVISDSLESVNMGDGKEPRVYIKATVTLSDGTDSISNTALAREPDTKKGMDVSQITGTSSSYARKYALNGLFLIDDTKDADTDEHSKVAKGDNKSKAPAKKVAAPSETKEAAPKKSGGFRNKGKKDDL